MDQMLEYPLLRRLFKEEQRSTKPTPDFMSWVDDSVDPTLEFPSQTIPDHAPQKTSSKKPQPVMEGVA